MSIHPGRGEESEREACEMARAAIIACQAVRGKPCDCLPGACKYWSSAKCPARVYLASRGDADAWQVPT